MNDKLFTIKDFEDSAWQDSMTLKWLHEREYAVNVANAKTEALVLENESLKKENIQKNIEMLSLHSELMLVKEELKKNKLVKK